MHESGNTILQHYGDYITSALRTEGGHLSVGRGGFTLHFGRGARLSGYDCESLKACFIAAGLPVIDSRMVAFEDVVRLAVRGPMVAVGAAALSCALFRPARCGGASLLGGRCRGLQHPGPREAGGGRVRGRPVGSRRVGSRERGSWPPVVENRYGFRPENHPERFA
jgi:hypothetical protein